MTTSPSGTGPGVNLSAVPASNADINANAQTENAKNALALIADSLKTADVSFVEHRPYKYGNHTNRPALSHPTQQTRVAVEKEKGPTTEAWQEKYEELINSLPEEVKTWMNEQFTISYYSRDLEFFAFHALLVTVAESLVLYEQALSPKPPESAIFERAKENLQLPYLAAQAAIVQGREVVEQSLQMWKEIGRNDPHFDKNINYLNQTKELLEELVDVISDLAKEPPDLTAANRLGQISQSIELLKGEYQATFSGKELQILGHVIDSLSMTTSSLLLGYGPASVLWMAALSDPIPTTAKTLGSLIHHLTEGLTATLNPGSQRFLSDTLSALLMTTLTTTMGIAEKGLGILPQTDEQGKKAFRTMTLSLSLQFVIHSSLLQEIYRALAAQLTTNTKTQGIIENGVYLSNLVLIVMATEKEGLSEPLFHSVRQDLLTLVEKVSDPIEAITDPKLSSTKIYLQQAKIALETESYSGFNAAYQGLLKSFNLSSKELAKEFEEINHIGSLIREAVKKGPDDATNRATTIQAI